MNRTLSTGLAVLAFFCFGLTFFFIGNRSADKPVQVCLPPDIASLVSRLSPLVKDPNGAWYRNGFTVTFYGTSEAKIALKLKAGGELEGRGATLREAVGALSAPANDIRSALEGW